MPKTAETIRQRIKASNLTERLQDFALAPTPIPVRDQMSTNQVRAAEILLNKVAPNLKAVDILIEGATSQTIRIVNYTELLAEKALELATREETPEMIDVTPADELLS